ncbi:MAG: hypothetical protein Q9163_005333 [Psora crenata]
MADNHPVTNVPPPRTRDLFPPPPPFNPSITPPFSKPSIESITTTLQPTPSEQASATTPKEDYDPTSSHPFSAFYSHPTTRTSLEQRNSESRVNIKIYDQDLESGSRSTQQPSSHGHFTPWKARKQECTMWPSTSKQLEKAHPAKTARGSSTCGPYRRLSKTQKLCIKVCLAILIVGAATGLGIGISKAVGSGVWKSNNSQAPIGPPDSN